MTTILPTSIPASHILVDKRQIAIRHRDGQSPRPASSVDPGVVWLGGYRSDMLGTKAEALDIWGAQNGIAVTRHDYSGHGESGGLFEEGTISRWLAESLAVFDHCTRGPQILVGSSMGGWIALRMAQELVRSGRSDRLAGIVLIAPAPDFTQELVEARLDAAQREALERDGKLVEPSEYGEPTIYTKALIDDGRNNLVLTGTIDTHCPVHILQGMADTVVPYAHAMRLVEHLPADDVTISLIRDGDHRLSRPQDIDMLLRAVAALRDRTATG